MTLPEQRRGPVRQATLVTAALWFAGGVWLMAGGACTGEGETFQPGGTGGAMVATGGSGIPTGSGGEGGAGGPTSTGGTTVPPAGSGGAAVAATGGRPAGSGGSTGQSSGGVTGGGGRTGIVTFPLPWMDNFETNAANGGAGGWILPMTDLEGKWAVAMDGANKVLQEQATVSSTSLIVGGDIAWTDQKVEARVKFAAVTSSSLALVAARFNNFDNYYFLHLKGDGSLKIRKRIVVGSSTTTIDVVTFKSGAALTAGTWYTVAIEIKGNVVTAYLNGAAVGTMTEAPVSLARGGIALGFQDAAGSFDDVKVTLP